MTISINIQLIIISGFLITFLIIPNQSHSHGTMLIPESRIYQCRFNGNPENHSDPACRAAIELAGKQPIYDWNGVRRGDADSQHQSIIPDGQLCSGGNAMFRGLDLTREDWRTTRITPDRNGQFEFAYQVTAPHSTKDMIFYITPQGWEQTQPLLWSELEEFCRYSGVPLEILEGKAVYKMNCNLPERTGKQVIFNVWQRSDSSEAFYSCSDVEFSDGSNGNYKQIGKINNTEDLPTGTRIIFRTFDEDFIDIEKFEITVQFDSGTADLWPFLLAEVVNSESALIRIGIVDDQGIISPTRELNSNLVYALSGRNLNFAIDKQKPNKPDIPDDKEFDYIYPEELGRYGPGTVVKGTDNNIYQCKPFPYSGWCNQAPGYYTPGTGYNWEDAWFLI